MKIKMIGLGQCGSFVVYDVIAYLFSQKTSKDLRTIRQSHWTHDLSQTISQFKTGKADGSINTSNYFKLLKLPDMPHFFVIDGNRNNAIIDGLQGHEINHVLYPLQSLANPLVLWKRNNGCHFGLVGEYVFRKEKESSSVTNVFNKIKSTRPVDINALVFAGGGGSGSGGAPVLNNELYNKDSILFNMLVLPPYYISARRQSWNTGRCIMRLASVDKQTSLLLFSNLSESLDDQYFVNQYICNLVMRLGHFGYPGNIPMGATDIDKKDLQVFFSGKPAFVGMSSLKKNDPSNEDIARMVMRAFTPRMKQGIFGLSIVYPTKEMEQKDFSHIRKVMIAIGLPINYVEKANIINVAKAMVAKRLGTELSKLDCCAYSYTSPDEVELTIFLRHDNYISNSLLGHFLDGYLKWYCGEQDELTYLNKVIKEPLDNNLFIDVRKAIEAEVDGKDLNGLKNYFEDYNLKEVIKKKLTA